jgi:hypothetical protein
MNCDTAFELMTDPGAHTSLELERHLAGCPRCRQMQEMLSPALSWMSEARESAPAASGGAERSPPVLTEELIRTARHAAGVLVRQSDSRWGRFRWRALAMGRGAAVACAGGLAIWLVVQGMGQKPAAPAECTRDQASQAPVGRSEIEIRALIAQCAACHRAAP